jgi:capsular polysaccharide transport system permease protein
VMTGYMPLTLFRHISNTNINLLKGSATMFYHRGISLWDVVIARALTEFIGTTIAAIVVYSTLYTFGQIELIEDFRPVVFAWLLIAYFAFGVGVCIAAFTELTEVAERFVQTFQYLQVPISGAFYMVDWIPSEAQAYVLYTPFVHGFEMFRDGVYGSTTPTYYSPSYLFLFSTVLVVGGLVTLKKARKNLHIG